MVGNNQKIVDKLILIGIAVVVVAALVVFIIFKAKTIRKIEISAESIYIVTGEQYVVDYKIVPKGAKNESLTWITDNEDAISIDHGVIVGKAPGNATVWVSSKKKPQIKSKLIVNVNTKLGRFKERLVKVFQYKQKDENLFQLEEKSTINFADKTFKTSNNGMFYTYYFKENVVVANPSQGNASEIRFNLNDGTHTCYSSMFSDFCVEENIQGVTRGRDFILDIFKGYLGVEYTIDDL